MPKKRKQYDDDDGRTVADMNVEGLPWYVQKREKPPVSETPEELDPAQKRAALRGMLAAALLIAGIFIVGALLFILFCLYIWLK